MRSSTIDVYADDRGCAVGLGTDDEEKGSTYGWRVVRGSSGVTFSCYALTAGMPIPTTRQLMIIAIPTIWQSAAKLPTPIRLL